MQRLEYLAVANGSGKHHGRRRSSDFRSMIEQQTRGCRSIPVQRRKHQGGILRFSAGVYIGAMVEQQLHLVRIRHGHHQCRRPPGFRGRVRIEAVVQKAFHVRCGAKQDGLSPWLDVREFFFPSTRQSCPPGPRAVDIAVIA